MEQSVRMRVRRLNPTTVLPGGFLRCAALVALLGIVSVAGVDATAVTASSRRPVLHGDVVWPPGKRRAPPFALRDEQGARISLGGERGRVVMLTFMYSRCRQLCPIEGRLLAAVERRLGRSTRALLLVVSVDPGGDTVSTIRRFIRRAGLTGAHCRWLVGSRRQLAPVWRSYRIDVQAGRDIGHSSALYLIDRHGFERSGYAVPFLPSLVAADVRTLAAERVSK